jgi:hypothetical protein
MDLNHLYHRRGVALLMADNAACVRSRRVHLDFVAAYAERIASVRADLGRPQLQAPAK